MAALMLRAATASVFAALLLAAVAALSFDRDVNRLAKP